MKSEVFFKGLISSFRETDSELRSRAFTGEPRSIQNASTMFSYDVDLWVLFGSWVLVSQRMVFLF